MKAESLVLLVLLVGGALACGPAESDTLSRTMGGLSEGPVIAGRPPEVACENEVTVFARLEECTAYADIIRDIFDPDDTVTCNPTPSSPFPVGTTQVKMTCTDQEGLSVECFSRVTVLDTQAPVITCPEPLEVQAGSDGWATVAWQPPVSATDNCSTPVVSAPTETRFAVGSTKTGKYTAMDNAGNEATCETPVTVRPPSPPGSLKDRAMLGGGCSAATAGHAPAPLVWMGLVTLWLLSAARRHQRLQRGRSAHDSPGLLGGWLLLGMLGMSPPASAQPAGIPSFELERLRLNPSGMGSWALGTGELLPASGYRLALMAHYEHKPLMLFEDGALLGVVVRHRLTTVLSAAVGLVDRVELGAQIPLLLMQLGDDLTGHNLVSPKGGVALGTPLLTVRLALLAEHQEAPVDLALGMSAGPGLGSAAALAREVHAMPNLMVGRRFGPLRASLDAGLLLRPRTILTYDSNIQDELGHAVRLGVGVASTAEGLGGEVAAIGSLPLRREGASLELLGGVRLPVAEQLEAHGLAGLGLGNAPGTPRFRLLLGMSWGKVTRPRAVAPEAPPPVLEASVDPDRDGDGVLDRVDACPDTAGIVEMRGCPPKDTDGDTVWDHLDNCRKLPGPPENQGCPASNRQWVIIQRNRIEIQDTIHFDYDKATIKSVSFPLLDQVARVLIEHPEIVSVSIEGHTDALGTDEYNRELAQRRASAVRDYLESRGVALERMKVRSFGEERPLLPNVTERGRAVNRRVEFITRYESDEP